MNKTKQNFLKILSRYLFLLILVLSSTLIYKVLTPITIYSSKIALTLFGYNVFISENFLIINATKIIQIIPACVAGSAYILLLILNFSVPMQPKKRMFSILFSITTLFILNIARITILSILYVNENPYFNFTHKLFWYALSTIFVIAIWFLSVKIFSIGKIPIYNDLKYLIKNIK